MELMILLQAVPETTPFSSGSNALQIIWFIIIIGLIVFVAAKYGIGRENNMKKKILDTENSLQKNGFIISKKVGDHDLWSGALGYYLYVDDVNKKWFIISYYSQRKSEIYKYEDLVDYDFFDVEAKDFTGKLMKGMLSTTAAIGGLAIGGVLGRGVLGAVIGGVTGSKATKIIFGTQGKSSSYGLVVRVNSLNNPELVLDFCNVILHSRIGNITKMEISRSDGKYKRDTAGIKEMANVFDYIIRSNMK